MDVAVDVYVAVPLLFTVLAVLIASLYMRLRPSAASVGEQEAEASKVKESGAGEEEEEVAAAAGAGGEEDAEEAKAAPAADQQTAKGGLPVEEVGAGEGDPQKLEKAANSEKGAVSPGEGEGEERSPPAPQPKREPTAPEEKLHKEEDEAEIENTKKSLPDEGTDDLVDEYRPGKIRGSSYEKTLTREELEEEQRIQREQLAAIFTLMKEKNETFGDMSEKDMEEQLKLYSL
ncbi:matrix-remodeling-associated protein 7-like isoform X2 [Scyliorhinus canicula]|uniref:matrix-remodeling-associated protein 7-like isoform X2 n=1 Tax=Scyliorhinus canicula TaxID=7830 RepID=UPI0018F4625E|nr:matrix-remodeling-associated protein 7-like isoform X2 [Scyliorhinus canicula]